MALALGREELTRQPLIYGAVVFAAIFFVGWVTGMGGSFGPNLVYSLLVGGFAAICFWLMQRYGKRPEE